MSPRLAFAVVAMLLAAPPAQAQDLARRIDGAPDGYVAISFAARPDVCGTGFSYLRIGAFGVDGSWVYNWSDGGGGQECDPGPVRVLLTRVERRITGVRVGVGRIKWPAGATDLGTVGAGAAGTYLLDLAVRLDGRAGRDALMAAAVADSTETWRGLLAVANNRNLSRGLRESAASWLGREAAVAGVEQSRELVGALQTLAKDQDAPGAVRSRAVSALGRSDAGLAAVLALAQSDEPTIARPAIVALGRFPDARAREALRRAARDSSIPRPVRVEAVKALGGRDASPADLAALRAIWPTLAAADLKGAVMQAGAETGGTENARWLLSVARDQSEPISVRTQAIRSAEQAGTGSGELIRLYDEAGDRRVKEAVIEALLRIGDRTARNKIGSIAEADTDPQLRRTAVSRLARDGDKRAIDILEAVVEKP